DRHSLVQSLQRIVPGVVQDVGEPEGEVRKDLTQLATYPLGVVDCLPRVCESRRSLTRNLTGENAEGIGGQGREQLLRRLRELDHPVVLRRTLARVPHQTQSTAANNRQGEARTHADPIGAEAEISLSTPKTFRCVG